MNELINGPDAVRIVSDQHTQAPRPFTDTDVDELAVLRTMERRAYRWSPEFRPDCWLGQIAYGGIPPGVQRDIQIEPSRSTKAQGAEHPGLLLTGASQ